MKTILVLGGLGYIGSHTCVKLIEKGYEVIIIDNLSNTSVNVLDSIEKIVNRKVKFYQGDILDDQFIESVFEKHIVECVIHFAGLKSVGESFDIPLSYYYNNVAGLMKILSTSEYFKVKHFIFSSSATVYNERISPVNETMQINHSSNPYGESKIMCERILKDFSSSNDDICISILRYFNPLGSHESGLIGENITSKSTNVFPHLLHSAYHGVMFEVYGGDYDTPDGSCVRDYIHVEDLADGHIAVLEKQTSHYEVYNLGTGVGTSVLELINIFESSCEIKLDYSIVEPREGDISSSYANVTKANRELNWECNHDIADMCISGWKYYCNRIK